MSDSTNDSTVKPWPNQLCCGAPDGRCSVFQIDMDDHLKSMCQGSNPKGNCLLYWKGLRAGTLAGATPRPDLPAIPPGMPAGRSMNGGQKKTGAAGGSFVERVARRAVQLKDAAAAVLSDPTLATAEQVTTRETACASCLILNGDWCDDTNGGCGCYMPAKRALRAMSCPQGKWFRHTDRYKPLVTPTRNLIFHLFPKLGAEWNWHWHLENIRHASPLFTGKIVIAIATGPGLAMPDDVQRMLDGIHCETFTVDNSRSLGETVSAVELLRRVDTADPNTITMRGHCKGVTHHRSGVEQRWAQLMWASCLDLPSVEEALASHALAGPLKCQEPLVGTKPWDWFYAGSFYWFRNADISGRDWSYTEPQRWWVEGWPGYIAKNDEAACLIHDFTDGSVLREDYWNSVVTPSWIHWQTARPARDMFYERPMA